MQNAQRLLQIDWKPFIETLIIVMVGVVALWKIIKDFMETTGLETKAMRQKRQRGEAIVKTNSQINKLYQQDKQNYQKLYKHMQDIITNSDKRYEEISAQNNQIREDVKRLSNDQIARNARRDQMIAMVMRNDIVNDCLNALQRKKISVRKLQSIQDLYTIYHDQLGENSYVTDLVVAVRKLPVFDQLTNEEEE